ncbi:TonB-dependent receptor [Brevundimonas pondensis]|uniref:TonB-dependent receptor n=1 Tax=Brevundimonas pondensis TaxID=2774189 RepID=A0ABX7SIK6_9CAUL|nr:TonB-dependent receptor [Brevundimonas pondensis]QTC86695.1 TonB-dependent receptor [Brevundimonas pondensis]
MSPAALLLALASLDPAAATTPATAQATQSQTPVVPAIEDQEAYDLGEIQAVSTKRRGAALGDYEPELVLDEEQLKAYGASSIQELMTLLEPVTRSSRGGSPVFLVNGRRISGFQEIRGIPPEAIERTEILPEETALSYGYSADQRVVNFVLKADFRSLTLQASARRPDEGGRTVSDLESNILRIAGKQRATLDLEYENDSPLYETERDIQRENGDPTAYRTLLPKQEQASVAGSVVRDLNDTTALTLSASLEDTSRLSYQGLPGVQLVVPPSTVTEQLYLNAPDALSRTTDTLAGKVGALVDGYLGDWRWTLTGTYDRTETKTRTGRGLDQDALQTGVSAGTIDPFGDADLLPRLPFDTARSVSSSGNLEGVINGAAWEGPAGALTSTFKVGFDTQTLDSESVRSGVFSERSLSRDRTSASGNFNLPIASRDREVLGVLGDLSANLNLAYQDLSDFGGLSAYTLGLNWSPWSPVSFTASWSDEQNAPSMSQLNDPTISTPNVPVYDFATGQSVNITRIEGGNAGLSEETKRILKLGFNFTPLKDKDLRLTANYSRTEVEGSIAAFPTITPELEAALPERFTRVNGVLQSIDARPLNFQKAEQQEIRWGLNFSTPFGKPDPAAAARMGQRGPGGGGPGGGGPVTMRVEGGPPPGGGMRMQMGGGGRGGRGPAMQPGQGRFNVSLYHTYRIQDEITIRDGLPVLDLLDGAATGARGGQSRNEVQFQMGLFKSGMGGFLNANWKESTRINGGDDASDLTFSDLTTVNLNLFADLSSRQTLVAKYPWLKGARVSVGIDNIFDQKLDVRNGLGETPLAYQPDYLDPLGRTFRVSFRKILF